MKTSNKWLTLFVICIIAFYAYAQEGTGKPGSNGFKGHSGSTGSKGTTGKQDIKLERGSKTDTAKTKAKDIPPDFDKGHPYK